MSDMNPFYHYLHTHSSTISFDLGFRMLLHDQEHLIFIPFGDVDLFYFQPIGLFEGFEDSVFVDFSNQNRIFLGDLLPGQLFFQGNFKKGDLLFPFPLCPEISPYKVVIKANSNTLLQKIKVEPFLNFLSDNPEAREIYEKLNNEWLLKLSKTFDSFPLPENLIYLHDGINGIDTNPINAVVPRHRFSNINWAKMIQGSAKIIAVDEFLLTKESPPFPLTPAIWINIDEPVVIEIYQEIAKLSLVEQYQSILNFQKQGVIANKKLIEFTSEAEKLSLAEKRYQDLLRLDISIQGLGNLLNEEVKQAALKSSDHLINVCNILGHYTGITFKNTLFKYSQKLQDKVYEISIASKVFYRQVLLGKKWWEKSVTPLLSNYIPNEKNSIALIPTKHGFQIKDPEKPHLDKTVNDQTAQSINPIAFMFYRQFSSQTPVSFVDLFKFAFHGTSKEITTIVLTCILTNGLAVFLPYFNQILFDEVIPSSDTTVLYQLIIGVLIIAASTLLFNITKEYAVLRMQAIQSHDLETAYWGRLINLSLDFFRKYSVGDLYQRLSAIAQIRHLISGYLGSLIINAPFALIFIGLMFYYSIPLALIGLTIIALGIAFIAFAFIRGITYEKKIQELTALLSGKIIQIISGISKIRIYGVENRIFSYWAETELEIKKLQNEQSYLFNLVSTLCNSLPSLCLLGIITVAMIILYPQGPMYTKAALSLGDYMAFSSAFFLAAGTIFGLGGGLMNVLSLGPTFDRSLPILKELPEIHTEELNDIFLMGKIEISHLFFRYDKNGALTHRNINLIAEPGELIAIVGRAGCGKSTLLKLLLGFEKPEKGGIFFDNKDIESLDLQQLRTQIGMVSQNSKVFDGTIQDNITGGKISSLEEVMRVVRIAGLQELIEELPMGLRTYISHGCDTLSGGQLQRLFIARALLGNPKILLLDEATNALDNKNQRNITLNIEQLNVTRVVIAHRLSTIRSADRIYVMADGTFVEVGTYEELINKNGHFKKLVSLQEL